MTSKRDKLQGQWVGSANGSNSGMVVLDLDELEDGYEGHAYLYDEAPGLPNVVAKIELGNKGVIHEKITCEVFPIHPSLPLRLSALDLAQDFPQVSFPQFVNIDLRLESDGIHASWETNIGTSGSAVLGFSQSQEPSQVDVLPDVIDWAAFKSYALGLKPREFIFRGQDKPAIIYLTKQVSDATRSRTGRRSTQQSRQPHRGRIDQLLPSGTGGRVG